MDKLKFFRVLFAPIAIVVAIVILLLVGVMWITNAITYDIEFANKKVRLLQTGLENGQAALSDLIAEYKVRKNG